eukprot:jgi/Galph1/90/GphlegSOOS_G4883.1
MERLASTNLLRNSTIKYFIAANMINAEHILPQFSEGLIQLVKLLGSTRETFVSIYENDSMDNTKTWLLVLRNRLRKEKIPHQIQCASLSSRHHLHTLKRMEIVRNMALAPLFRLQPYVQDNARVVFLNDIFLNAAEIYQLIQTREQDYDWVCGMDFYRGFYDRFATRDRNGRIFNRWYPYIRDRDSKLLLIRGQPFQVRACWNGAAVFRAWPILKHKLNFTSTIGSFEDPCRNPRSECHTLALSFRKLNYTNMWINPQIHLTYDKSHHIFQQLIQQHFRPFFGLFNDLLLSWTIRKEHLEQMAYDACPKLPMLCC